MRRRKGDENSPEERAKYEQSYGDAEPGGWAPRRRSDDISERSRYSSQRDRQEDRSGFRRGYQGGEEVSEQHQWGATHQRSDERNEDAGTAKPQMSGAEAVGWIERAVRRSKRKPAPAKKKPSKKKPSKKKPSRASAKAPATGPRKTARSSRSNRAALRRR